MSYPGAKHEWDSRIIEMIGGMGAHNFEFDEAMGWEIVSVCVAEAPKHLRDSGVEFQMCVVKRKPVKEKEGKGNG